MYASSHNEWDPLKHVFVGDAENAHWPVDCPIYRKTEETTGWKNTPVPEGPVDTIIIREANADLFRMRVALMRWATIWKPKTLDFQAFDGMYNYCPRDRVLIVGDRVIDAPMMFPTRRKEIDALKDAFDNEIITCDDPEARCEASNGCLL